MRVLKLWIAQPRLQNGDLATSYELRATQPVHNFHDHTPMSQFPYAATGHDLSTYNADAQPQLPFHIPPSPTDSIDSIDLAYISHRHPSPAERQAGRPAPVGHAGSTTSGYDGQGAEDPHLGELHLSCL